MTVPVYAWFPMLLGEPLTRDGGSRYKGVNSLKSSEDLWGPVRWHSRLDPFPYSEPLTNLTSYFGARGISDKWSHQAPDALIPPLMKLLVDVLSRYVEKTGELTLDGCERVRHEDALGRGRRPLDECRVLLDRRG
ncbi:hypothetical protein CRG98_020243 [Punica granatum]|uniref:Uncharacterized protein n=1 Tax=Punica granatum TaxID=22663 RepID=A0A2I0JSU8_PUNGR|nr:hypothetical protein CRG98_020243 [Punica granatum]